MVCEVGIFVYCLLVDMVVINFKYVEIVEKKWKLLKGMILIVLGYLVV